MNTLIKVPERTCSMALAVTGADNHKQMILPEAAHDPVHIGRLTDLVVRYTSACKVESCTAYGCNRLVLAVEIDGTAYGHADAVDALHTLFKGVVLKYGTRHQNHNAAYGVEGHYKALQHYLAFESVAQGAYDVLKIGQVDAVTQRESHEHLVALKLVGGVYDAVDNVIA